MRSPIDPPPRTAQARFAADFGQRFLITVEIGEAFERAQSRTHDTSEPIDVARIARFQRLCEAEGVAPVYLADGTIARSAELADMLRGPLAAGKAEIGIQLRPALNPPAGRERAELLALRTEIVRNFGSAPVIYRAVGRGAGALAAATPRDSGIGAGSPALPHFDDTSSGGRDDRRHPIAPYWADATHSVLQLPLTSVFWGLLRRQGEWLDPLLAPVPRLHGALARLGLLQRIALTCPGISVEEAIRGIDIALDDGLPLLVFAFDCSLRDADGALQRFHDWWTRVFAYLELRAVRPTTVRDVLRAAER
ncbi:MAG: hypothetical protein B7Z08_06935 [Sphingomonadales bacterium 32-68-7]|nr:MAG: hypothetical protein B7Z33_03870 [Sphingomonadales bacterium 12-68-11]OYX08980.1 MAG: hypothetical protein B7Z08_06935 [Sphingomonadales bacterium 32-68-7]